VGVHYSVEVKPAVPISTTQLRAEILTHIAGGKSYRRIAGESHDFRGLMREIGHNSPLIFSLSSIHPDPLKEKSGCPGVAPTLPADPLEILSIQFLQYRSDAGFHKNQLYASTQEWRTVLTPRAGLKKVG
jgi:hypothetical protein